MNRQGRPRKSDEWVMSKHPSDRWPDIPNVGYLGAMVPETSDDHPGCEGGVARFHPTRATSLPARLTCDGPARAGTTYLAMRFHGSGTSWTSNTPTLIPSGLDD